MGRGAVERHLEWLSQQKKKKKKNIIEGGTRLSVSIVARQRIIDYYELVFQDK